MTAFLATAKVDRLLIFGVFFFNRLKMHMPLGDMLAGLSADLEKCFNCIPRFPALCLAVLVGTPDAVTTAWSGALASMRRHFKVRDSFSSGFLTSTGLAEGCGLSVFGMLLVDHLFACWMRFQTPAIQCLTYVDDWQTLTSDPDFAVRQLDLIERFAGMVDLTVDKKKTFGWATCPHTRSLMRASGIRVLHHARELGGHLGISRQYTNCTLTQRIEALEDFWSKLKSSKAKYLAKLFMLRAVAWPRGLHAVASVPVGDQIWLNLRRQAVRALGWKKPGVNPAVLLGLVESAVDPQFTAILWTLRAARSHYPCDFWHVCVAPLAHGDLDLPPNAPASVLLHRVQALGVGVSGQGSWLTVLVPFVLSIVMSLNLNSGCCGLGFRLLLRRSPIGLNSQDFGRLIWPSLAARWLHWVLMTKLCIDLD